MTLCSILRRIHVFAAATALLAVLVLSAAPKTMAQMAPAADKPDTAPQGAAKLSDRVEKRIAELHEQLKITPAEETAWTGLASVMREDATKKMATYGKWSQEQSKMNALELMKAHAQLADENAQTMHKMLTAFEALYNVMSDDQKKNADEVFSYRMAKAKKMAGKMHRKMEEQMDGKMDGKMEKKSGE